MQQQNQKTSAGIASLLDIKQQLDQRRIHGNISPESAPLVLKLLSMIKRLQQTIQQKHTDSTLEQTISEQEEALVFQLKELTTQNNALRLQVLAFQDELDSHKLKMQDLCAQSLANCNQKSSLPLIRECKRRQDELRQQLAHTVYKYNQLMDLLHQNPAQEREYIKRLLKPKNLAVADRSPSLEANYPRGELDHSTASQRISILQAQLLARNAEIQRLQSVIVDQCVEIARHNWYNKKESLQIGLLQEQLASLTSQNRQLQRTLRLKSSIPNPNKPNIRSQSRQFDLKFAEVKRKQLARNQQQGYYVNIDGPEPRSTKVGRCPASPTGQNLKNQDCIYLKQDPYHFQQKNKTFRKDKLKALSNQHQLQKGTYSNSTQLLLKNQKIRQHFTKKADSHSNVKQQATRSAKKPLLAPPSNQKLPSKGSASHTSQREAKAERQRRQSTSLDHQEKARFERELEQKEARIAELKELLRLSPRKVSTIINKTQNIHSQQNQTNNLIINENPTQSAKASYNQPSSREACLQQKLTEMQMELAEASQARDRLQDRLHQFQQQIHLNAEQNTLKEALRLERDQRQAVETKLKQAQHQLISVNQENISLQRQINQHRKFIEIHQKEPTKTQLFNQPQNNNGELMEDCELWRLRREVERLKRQLSVLQAEKAVLYKQLSQTEVELNNQSREMARFERSIGKRYRDKSP